jgi:hypothetical protein
LLNICNSTILAAGGLYLVVLFILGLYAKAQEDYGNREENKEKQITEAKFEALSNQMNLTLF